MNETLPRKTIYLRNKKQHELYEKLRIEAIKQNKPKDNILFEAIEQYLKKQKKE